MTEAEEKKYLSSMNKIIKSGNPNPAAAHAANVVLPRIAAGMISNGEKRREAVNKLGICLYLFPGVFKSFIASLICFL